MKVGKVVRVRVNPADCMGCVDIVRTLGVNTVGMSFAAVVSLALRSALATLRDNKVIPTRDGFEFAAMMEPFQDQPAIDRVRKLDITNAIETLSKVHGLTSVDTAEIDPAVLARFKELKAKAFHDRSSMTIGEIEEYSKLATELGGLDG